MKFSGRKLGDLMQLRALGVEDVATAVGRDKSTVSNWVNEVRSPNPRSQRDLAKFLQVSIKELLKEGNAK